MSDEVQIRQRMTMHLNGGSKFSELHYVVVVDGAETKITRHTRTDGSPEYRIVADELHHGDDTLDLRAIPKDADYGATVRSWIEARAQ